MNHLKLTTYFSRYLCSSLHFQSTLMSYPSSLHRRYLPLSGLLLTPRIHLKILTVLQSTLNTLPAEQPKVYIFDITQLTGWRLVPVFGEWYSALSAQPQPVGPPHVSRALRCIFILRAELYINYPTRRHAAVIKQILMKSWPTHSSNIIQGTKTDDAALMSLHVIHFQLVRDLGNHWNLIQSILAAHNEIWPYMIFQYLFWFQIVVITRIHKNTKKSYY